MTRHERHSVRWYGGFGIEQGPHIAAAFVMKHGGNVGPVEMCVTEPEFHCLDKVAAVAVEPHRVTVDL